MRASVNRPVPLLASVLSLGSRGCECVENWSKRLPTGPGRINYSTEVLRNRRRAADEGYLPHAAYPGRLQDAAALRTQILENYRNW